MAAEEAKEGATPAVSEEAAKVRWFLCALVWGLRAMHNTAGPLLTPGLPQLGDTAGFRNEPTRGQHRVGEDYS